MNIFLFTLLSLIFSVDSIFSLKLSGRKDARIRRGLLKLLSRYHQGQAPLFDKLHSVPMSPKGLIGGLIDLPISILWLVASEFINPDALSNFSVGNRGTGELVDYHLKSKLLTFCPHFVSEDRLLNVFIHSVILEHFPDSKSEKCETFHDELQVLTSKFVHDKLTFDSIPRNIYFYVLAFLHEVAYGKDAVVPSNGQAWFLHTLRLLTCHKLPKFWKYTEDLMIPDVSESWRQGLISFNEHFVESDIEANPNSQELTDQFLKEFIFEVVYAEMRIKQNINVNVTLSENLFQKCQRFGINFSSELFDQYARERILQNNPLSHHLTASDSSLANILIVLRASPAPFDYFWTRNSVEQFSLAEFNESAYGLLKAIAEIRSPSLAHLDAFSQVVVEGGLNSNDLSSVLVNYNNYLFFEIIVKESIVPLQMFYRNSQDSLRFVWSPIFFPANMKFSSFFVKLKSNDPFIFLTFNPIYFGFLRSSIKDKFNLNLRYSIELTADEVSQIGSEMATQCTCLDTFIGQIVSFKEIVNGSYLSEFKHVFTSTPEEFVDLSTVDMVTPPTSINSQTIYNYF